MTTETKVKERGILFSGPMVRAIIEGRKTQTRRPMKPNPDDLFQARTRSLGFSGGHDGFGWYFCDYEYPEEGSTKWNCPYGQPGDRLWVRETFTIESTYEYPGENLPTDGRPIKKVPESYEAEDFAYEMIPRYRATEPETELYHEEDCRQCEDNGSCSKWKPSIHMPRWASRITLEITSVRVERIQDITELDAKAEGSSLCVAGIESSIGDEVRQIKTHRVGFVRSWNVIYPGAWSINEWVWVISFKVIKP